MNTQDRKQISSKHLLILFALVSLVSQSPLAHAATTESSEAEKSTSSGKFSYLSKRKKTKEKVDTQAASQTNPHLQLDQTDANQAKVSDSQVRETIKINTIGINASAKSLSAPDPALVSILKDIIKSLADSPDLNKIEDPTKKAAAQIAKLALEAAVNNPDLDSNRIIAQSEKSSAEKALSCEVWNSGDIAIGDGGHASFSALWAKKSNGLVNLVFAGRGANNQTSTEKVGEFVFVLSGKSNIENGFDIQTQAPVSYWLGKLSGFEVDASDVVNNKASNSVSTNIILEGPLTEKKRELLAKVTRQPEQATISPQASVTAVDLKTAEPSPAVSQTTNADAPRATSVVSEPVPLTPKPNQVKPPSQSAQLVIPDKAMAGQYLTVSVISANRQVEKSVELTFNGTKAITSSSGQAKFLVPDDLTPGPTLQVSLTGKPEAAPIQVLQPLVKVTSPQTPLIDLVSPTVPKAGTLTINGHNFDGIAEKNKVSIDGKTDARILAASPMQLKVDVPSTLAVGQHAIVIQTQGLASTAKTFLVMAPPAEPVKQTATSQKKSLLGRALGAKKPKQHQQTASTRIEFVNN
jgi:hypothetical protein